MEEDTVVVVVAPRAFIEWKELAAEIEMIERYIDILWQAVLDAVHDIADLLQIPQSIAEESPAEETQTKPKYGPATSSCSCLVLLRLDLLPYYTSGFRSCRLGEQKRTAMPASTAANPAKEIYLQ